MKPDVDVAPDIRGALESGTPVIALESTVFLLSLDRARRLHAIDTISRAVAAEGAVAAPIFMLGGRINVGVDDAARRFFESHDDFAKVAVGDLALASAKRMDAATTVSSTLQIAGSVGIKTAAFGGLGGVHRGATTSMDISPDLNVLARSPLTVVCSGFKSILDVGLTLEAMETLGLSLVGYGTRQLPCYYMNESGFQLRWVVDSPAEVGRIERARRSLGMTTSSLILANPVRPEFELDPEAHDRALAAGEKEVAERGVSGAAVTPIIMRHLGELTAGASVDASLGILLDNAVLASHIATSPEER